MIRKIYSGKITLGIIVFIYVILEADLFLSDEQAIVFISNMNKWRRCCLKSQSKLICLSLSMNTVSRHAKSLKDSKPENLHHLNILKWNN